MPAHPDEELVSHKAVEGEEEVEDGEDGEGSEDSYVRYSRTPLTIEALQHRLCLVIPGPQRMADQPPNPPTPAPACPRVSVCTSAMRA